MPLLQFCILRLGFLQRGDVRVGVFPECEEVFVRGESPNARRICVGARRVFRLQRIRTRHAEARQRARPTVPHYAAMVENLLELGGGLRALSSS